MDTSCGHRSRHRRRHNLPRSVKCDARAVRSRLSDMADLDSALDKALDKYENKPAPKAEPSQSTDSDLMQPKRDNETVGASSPFGCFGVCLGGSAGDGSP